MGNGVALFFAYSLVGFPTYVLLRHLAKQLQGRLWRRLFALLGVSLIASSIVAVIWLVLDSIYVLDADQRYSWQGWWTIWPAGLYGMGIGML